ARARGGHQDDFSFPKKADVELVNGFRGIHPNPQLGVVLACPPKHDGSSMVGTEIPMVLDLETGLAPAPGRPARRKRDGNDDGADRRHQRDEVGRLLGHWRSCPSDYATLGPSRHTVPCQRSSCWSTDTTAGGVGTATRSS